MPYDADRHHRRSICLRGYDYAQEGAYYVTICVQNRACLLGEVIDDEMCSNAIGQMVSLEWERLPERFPTIILDVYVVMPNHLHGIVVLVGAPLVGAPGEGGHKGRPYNGPPVLGSVIGASKSISTNAYIDGVRDLRWPPFPRRFWQRGYYEHIIRSDRALDRIREYIATNPARWALDPENPDRQGEDEFDRWIASCGGRPLG